MDFKRNIKTKSVIALVICASLYTTWDVQGIWRTVDNNLPKEKQSNGDPFEEGWTAWGNRQELRKRILTATCNDLHVSQRDILERLMLAPDLHFRHLLVDERNEVIYCYIPEIARDSWGTLWKSLTGESNNTSLSSLYQSHNTQKRTVLEEAKAKSSLRLKLMTYTKIIVVQHPFLRLLSTYRDNVNKKPGDHYLQSAIAPSNSSLSWPEFVNFLTKGSGKMVDSLWKPYEILCHPCAVEYDVVAKAETLREDSERFLRRVGAPEGVHFPPDASDSSIQANGALWNEYQEMLSEEQLDALRKAYQRDLKLFAYK
ncbi:carbohydrate sulfotransferase 14-like [Palaemon carinicauda]|uniref:carbohydrate sulfotransferase 14-like n=1 Tax=Palaemon carinicauda TaxID=392227 RepID=UPI0035B60EC0